MFEVSIMNDPCFAEPGSKTRITKAGLQGKRYKNLLLQQEKTTGAPEYTCDGILPW